jgi:hypothetical protein
MRAELVVETEDALRKIASILESYVPHFVSLQPDGSGSPQMLALRDALRAYPVPADVLYIDDSRPGEIDEIPGSFTLLRFAMAEPKTLRVNYVDTVRTEQLEAMASLLETHFDAYPGALRLICDLQLGSMLKDDRFTFLVRSDIRREPEECARDLAMHIFTGGKSFWGPFLLETDFRSKYDLQSDSILTDDELVKWNPISEQYRDSSYQQLSLRERQENVASIQLIPQVPESVREVIRRAKRLYIFGHFEYSFFTVADHYAYAALEAAIFHRWNATLPAKLQLLYEHKKRRENAVLDRTGWRRIQDYCRQQGWHPQNLEVNGRAFPTSASKVVDRLREDRILNDWQHWRMRNVYLSLRNSHSHLEFCSTSLPGADTIEHVVREINTLFDSLPFQNA